VSPPCRSRREVPQLYRVKTKFCFLHFREQFIFAFVKIAYYNKELHVLNEKFNSFAKVLNKFLALGELSGKFKFSFKNVCSVHDVHECL
jgi:hypothetical protein